jgi:hypothetical protein
MGAEDEGGVRSSEAPLPSGRESMSSVAEREKKPYWISVSPSPALEPNFAACVVCKRYVRRKPTNWKKNDVKRFEMNEKIEPEGRSPTIIPASVYIPAGACTTVSQ